MKDCRECEFFNGYDYSDGTPNCEYENGYENCPYNDETAVKNNGIKIEVDAGFMQDYIHHTLKNTVAREARHIAAQEIKSIVTEGIKDEILEEMRKQIKTVVSDSISDFMGKEISVGGGWLEPERTLTRTEYLAETIEKELKDRFKSDSIKDYAVNHAKRAIDDYDKKLRSEINSGIKNYFDEATRQILTENVVSMLMTNDTYQKLSKSMQTFLP